MMSQSFMITGRVLCYDYRSSTYSRTKVLEILNYYSQWSHKLYLYSFYTV